MGNKDGISVGAELGNSDGAPVGTGSVGTAEGTVVLGSEVGASVFRKNEKRNKFRQNS